jgi:hypothetical protein
VEHSPPWGATEARVQLAGTKLPPAPPSAHETMPLGNEGVALRSRTVAVRVVAIPGEATPLLGETSVLVTAGGGGGAARGRGAPPCEKALAALAANTSTKSARTMTAAVRRDPALRLC